MTRPIPRHRWPVTADGATIGHLTLPSGPDRADTDDYDDQFNVTEDGELAAVEVRLTVTDGRVLAVDGWFGDTDPVELAAVLHAWADHLSRAARR
jgi:hypothetical protein